MIESQTIAGLPREPAVYALYAGRGRAEYVVYVGYTTSLKTRMVQHLVTRDSSINSATAAAKLNPECITGARWWTLEEFNGQEEKCLRHLQAAELVAFKVLDPVLRSNAHPNREARQLANSDAFRDKMTVSFNSEPTGYFRPPDAEALFKEISNLNDRL